MRWQVIQINNEETVESPINLTAALDWLCKSGIQDNKGGFYAWYDTTKCEYSFLYPEITGYAIRLLCKAHKQTGSNYLSQAVKAADWLLSIQTGNGSFFCKQFPKTGTYDESFYVFDAGIIASALIDIYKLTANDEYIKAALKTMNYLLSLQKIDGSFNAASTVQGSLLNNSYWSQTSGCHHLKLLLPLLQTYDLTLDSRYLKASKKLLNWGLSLQMPNGQFLDFNNAKTTYTHAHCYATEGLLGAFECLDPKTAVGVNKKIEKSLSWLLNRQNDDGSFYNWNDNRLEKTKVSDALSQALKLYLLTSKSSARNLEKGFAFLKQAQLLEGTRRVYGGVVYGVTHEQKIGHVSACATIFAIDAALLTLYGETGSLLKQII